MISKVWYDPLIHDRRSLRLKGYDYTNPGYYYVTINVQDQIHLFGEIENKKIHYNEFGRIVRKTWLWLERQYSYIELDEWILMPDHLHGIIAYKSNWSGRSQIISTVIKPLGRLIGAFKTVSTKKINIVRNTTGCRIWQRDFYDHIIRNEDDLERIRWYIKNNPKCIYSNSI